VTWIGLVWAVTPSYSQTPGAVQAEPLGAAPTNAEMLEELRALRKEVNDAKALKDQVIQLQNELANLRGPTTVGASPASGAAGGGGVMSGGGGSSGGTTYRGGQPVAGSSVGRGTMVGTPAGEGAGDTAGMNMYRGGQPRVPQVGDKPGDDFPLRASYRYNANATGPLGGGGYLHLGDDDDEFGINLTNQITIDSTNFDRMNMPTSEQGFNIPFARTFLYGNITKDWMFQIGTQGFLGTFNLLDMFMSYHVADWLTIRAGKGLAPPLYEYYAFTPALEPVITNSPLFQFAAARPIGIMASGNLLTNKIQYMAGINNTGKAFYYALDRNMEFNGAVDFTPFKGTGSILENFGGGFGYSAGWQNYALQQSGAGFALNGEATTNSSYITSSGIPFFAYNDNVRAQGQRIRVSPHIYYYGRFSVLAEYMLHSRELTDGTTTGRSTQRAYYVNLSYYLTGERDYGGNGFQAYSTTTPLRPFIPSRGEWGPGAWQIAAQFSEVNAGTGDFARGFADPTRWTNRLDQLMVGVNWWPNKYTRLSFDYVWTYFNRPIPVNSPLPIQTFNTFWFRAAMFF
jgi:phosphate-selective porin OprO/OprP